MSKRHRLTERERDELLLEELFSRYNQLRGARYTFAVNFQELRKLIEHAEEGWLSIPVRDPITLHSPEHLRQMGETSRLLHNYLAAAMTLKDHTNRVVDKVFTDRDAMLYDDRVESTFVNNPLCCFVQDLRNYSLHRSLPLAGSRVTLENGGPTTVDMTLNKEKLLEWGKKKWTKKSSQYLTGSDERISILTFSGEYYNEVRLFHQWLEQYFFGIYAPQFDYYLKSERERIETYIPPSSVREFYLRELTVRNSDILIDDAWTFDL